MASPTSDRPAARVPPGGVVGACAVLAALVGALLWLALLSAPLQLGSGLLDASRHLKRAQRALSAGAIKQARAETLDGAEAAERASAGLAGPLVDVARVLPVADDLLEETDHIVAAVEHSSAAALGTLDVAQNALEGPDRIIFRGPPGDPDSQSQIRLDRIEEIGGIVGDVRRNVQAAARELGAVDTSHLPRRFRPDVADALAEARRADDVLADAEDGFELLPGFLGADEPRTYLIGMQNSAELRGTGGAILQFALLSFDGGRPSLGDSEAQTVYKIDRDRRPLDIPLPEDAWYVRAVEDAQRFGNSNWSPDWPLSSELMIEYARASDERLRSVSLPEIDGVIAADPVVMEDLIQGIGPYRIGFGNQITSRRVVQFLLNEAYGKYPIPGQRRAVLKQVVDGFYERLFEPDHPPLLVDGLTHSLATKHMQLWLADADEQAFVERMGWDGAIAEARNSDFVYVVEQNVGGNKLDYFSHRTTTVEVTPDGSDALVSAEVEIENTAFLPQPRYFLGDTRDGRHRPMINVYVPQDSELTGAPRVRGRRLDTAPEGNLATWVDGRPPEHFESDKKVWPTTLEVPAGGKGSVRLDYRVPGVVRTTEGRTVYRLVVQHQPRVHPEALVVRFALPDGASSVRAPGWTRDGDTLEWERPLTKDLVLEVSWRS